MFRRFPKSILLAILVACFASGGKAAEPYAITIGVVPGQLLYDVVDFEVAAGSPVKVTFDNNGLMPHNVLFTRPGKAMEVVNAAMAMGADGYSKGYVPESGQILASSRLLEAGQKQELEFVAPGEPGSYPFVCTFPGHGNIMQGVMRVVAAGTALQEPLRRKVAKVKKQQGPPDDGSGVTPRPLGSREKPLVMRTFMPNPIRVRTVFPHHHRGQPTPTYDPNSGRDTDGYIDTDIGFPAAVGINFGKELSLCWDTTECRFMYAWRDGFLNMENYWGAGSGDQRKSFDYVPQLEGRLVFLAEGPSPLALTPGVFGAPRYKGFRLRKNGVPEFLYSVGSVMVAESIEPGTAEGEIRWHFSIQHAPAGVMLGFEEDVRKKIQTSDGEWSDKVLTINNGSEKDFTLLLKASETVVPREPVLPAVGGVIGGAKSIGAGADKLPELVLEAGVLDRGQRAYVDSGEVIGTVPEEMRGSDLVRTRLADGKAKDALVYEIELKGEAGVFVLTDGKLKERPQWLDERFSDSGLRIPVSGKRFFRVWSALLPAGGYRFEAVTADEGRLQIVLAARKK
jgi:azurin